MYEIVVRGHVQRTLLTALDDFVDEWRPSDEAGLVVARVIDQSRLVPLIDRLHELGVSIDGVRVV